VARTRNSLSHKLLAAARRPALIPRHLRRVVRNRRLRKRTASHPEFYRAVMADDVERRTAAGAVGTPSSERWEAIGRKQFRFLKSHGLERRHRMLEIGCGNLRAGRHFIRYLRPGHYTGVDISPEILLAAQQTLVSDGLQPKQPRLYLVAGSELDFLADSAYDVVHAHSVFTHTPLEVIDGYFAAAFRALRPGGFFDFTYHHTDDAPWDFLQEDYYYPTDFLLGRAATIGFTGFAMDDWIYSQSKIRLVKPNP